jgi:16S rRNA processing protein RimM
MRCQCPPRWHFCFYNCEMNKESCYKIGYLVKPHGLQGQVTISLDPDAPEDFSPVQTVLVERNEHLLPYFIETISLKGKKGFLKFEEVNTAEEAKNICKSSVYLPKSMRPKSGRGEFYDDEVVGFDVLDSSLGPLGKVKDIIHAGPNKLLSVDCQGKEVLIPLNSPFIDGINKSRRKITVTLPEGFLEI